MNWIRTTRADDPHSPRQSAGTPVPPERAPDAHEVDAHDVAVARALLLVHRLDPERHACAGCGAGSPCAVAQDAATVIVEAGAWNTLPFPGPLAQWGARADRRGVLARLAASFNSVSMIQPSRWYRR